MYIYCAMYLESDGASERIRVHAGTAIKTGKDVEC